MLSYAGKSIGRGWVFGLNEGLDQAGATLGPLIIALVLFKREGYQIGFGVFWLVLTGMILWGIGMGAQNSLLKAMLSSVIPAAKRGTGFGLFYTGFGVAWFIGSAAMGYLYDRSLITLIIFSVVCQLAALPTFLWGNTEAAKS